MKDEFSKLFAKNREDTFDILHLRAREIKILYTLFVVLLFTIIYEYKEPIYETLIGIPVENESLLLDRGKKIRIVDLKGLQKSLEGLSENYPQFSTRLNRDMQNLKNSIDTISSIENISSVDEIQKLKTVLNSIYNFVSHHAVEKNEKTIDFEKQIIRVAKNNNIELSIKEEITPLVFKKTVASESDNPRNLFEYGEM